MMSDAQLMKFALAVSVTGLVVLFVLSAHLEPQTAQLQEISEPMVGQHIATTGQLTKLAVRDGTLFAVLHDEGAELRLVMFRADTDAHEGDRVQAEGTLALYRGELELVARKIYKK